MAKMRRSGRLVEAKVAYAGDPHGRGIALVSLATAHGSRLLRLPFRTPHPRGEDRAIGYAALTEAAKAVRELGCRRVKFTLGDARLVDQVGAQRDLPETLALAYVRLRCALNALEAYAIKTGATEDLTQRARAEAALNLVA